MTASSSPAAPAAPPATGYPAARRDDLVENLHGHRVPDPYRWLEDAASAETREWLRAQDALWAGAEAGLPGRPRLAARLRELMAAGYISSPVWRGPRQFFMRRRPGQEHGVLLTAAPGEPERVLIDPAALDPAGLTTLDSWQPDQEGRLLAYQLSSGGDEESQLRVLDVVSGAQVDGPIGRCRYSPVAWLPGGQAFYYVRKLPPGQVPPGEEQFHRRVYLHTVGAPADEDVAIFGEGRDKTNYYGALGQPGRPLAGDLGRPGHRPPQRRVAGRPDRDSARPSRTSRWCRRAWTPGPGCTWAGTAGCTSSPTRARRGAGWR